MSGAPHPLLFFFLLFLLLHASFSVAWMTFVRLVLSVLLSFVRFSLCLSFPCASIPTFSSSVCFGVFRAIFAQANRTTRKRPTKENATNEQRALSLLASPHRPMPTCSGLMYAADGNAKWSRLQEPQSQAISSSGRRQPM